MYRLKNTFSKHVISTECRSILRKERLEDYFQNHQKQVSPICNLPIRKDFRLNFILDASIYSTANQKFFYGEVLYNFMEIFDSKLDCQLKSYLYLYRDDMLETPMQIEMTEKFLRTLRSFEEIQTRGYFKKGF